jgi:hypothetical protein
MKRILFITCTAIGLSVGAYAQFTVGPKVGLNLSTVQDKGDMPQDPSRRQGLTAGAFLNYRLTSSLELQGELLYSQQGYKEHGYILVFAEPLDKIRYSEAKRRLHYLSVPILFRDSWGRTGLYVELGPQVGFLLHHGITSVNYEMDADSYALAVPFSPNRVDFSAVGGAGFRFPFGITLSGRYCYGLTNAWKDLTSRNHVIQFALTYDLRSF